MTTFKMEVLGTEDLKGDLQRIAEGVKPPHVTEMVKKGADIILDQTQRNILERELYDTGDLYDNTKMVVEGPFTVAIVVDVPYGRVHEYGGTFVITPKQRRFFWAKWSETGNTMWKALALSETYTIPPRPYLRPAVDEKKEAAVWEMTVELTRYFTKVLKIGGTK